jgi:hypothetical protein
MNITLDNEIKNHFIKSTDYFSFQSINKFINYFFPNNINIKYDDNNFNSKIYGIQLEDNTKLDNTKINILICVENCSHFTHYKHYNKYGNYGNDKISIYLYNHISNLVLTDKYIAIPIIYIQINYFNNYYDIIQPTILTPFNKKKFCIFISNNSHRINVKNIIKYNISKLGHCDVLEIYKPLLFNKSCYHSVEFINILQQYKFVFVCENSLSNGYITEKIFNCFFARSIPIYNGCQQIERFFNINSFINLNNIDNNILKKIKYISDNEIIFNTIINSNKINKDFNDEDYKIKLKSFIDSRL